MNGILFNFHNKSARYLISCRALHGGTVLSKSDTNVRLFVHSYLYFESFIPRNCLYVCINDRISEHAPSPRAAGGMHTHARCGRGGDGGIPLSGVFKLHVTITGAMVYWHSIPLNVDHQSYTARTRRNGFRSLTLVSFNCLSSMGTIRCTKNLTAEEFYAPGRHRSPDRRGSIYNNITCRTYRKHMRATLYRTQYTRTLLIFYIYIYTHHV